MGASKNKLSTLRHYDFTIAFESTDQDGDITEKLIQPLLCGTIPLYWGGGTYLGETVPDDCYVDCKALPPALVLERLRSMGDEEKRAYREAAVRFLRSPQGERFTWGHWARRALALAEPATASANA